MSALRAASISTPPLEGSCPSPNDDDDRLLALYIAGEPRAITYLVRRHNQRLFRVARAILDDDFSAEEAVQEAYIRAFSRLESYGMDGGFRQWMTRVVANAALDRRRSERRRQEQSSMLMRQAEASRALQQPHAPENAIQRAQLRSLLESAIGRLPIDLRTVVVLRAVEQCSIAETAELLQIPGATVKTRLHRAVTRLRADLGVRAIDELPDAFQYAGRRCREATLRITLRLLMTTPAPRGADPDPEPEGENP